MSKASESKRKALRQILVILAVGVPLSIAAFLGSGGFFDSYHAQAVSWRPLPRSDGVGDQELQILLAKADGSTLEKRLPTRAFKGLDLPREPSALLPVEMPEDAPVVHRDLFSATIEVTPATGGKRIISTIRPINGVIPLLALLAVLLGRNLVMTGSVFRLVSDGKVNLPGVRQEPQGRPVQKKPRSKKGPPPKRRRKGR